MLIITRRKGESLEISLSPEIDPGTPVGELLDDYPIRIVVDEMRSNQVALALDASRAFLILREELIE